MNDIYNRCLNCGEILIHTEGKREKVFCDTTCRSNYWQKSDRLEKKGLTAEQIVATVSKSWKQVTENKKPENKAKLDAERNRTANSTKKEIKQPLAAKEVATEPKKEKEGELTSFQLYQRKKLGLK